jgi:tetratricopeptide (TPR) repeat protein
MNKNSGCFFFFIFILLLSTPIFPNDTTTFHNYFWANYNQFSGNLTNAQHWYKNLFSTNCSLYTYKGYLSFLFDTKQYRRIVELIPSLDKNFEKDAEIQLLFASALEHCNNNKLADDRLIKICNSFKINSEITLRAAQAYLRRKEPENALLTVDAFLNNSPRKPNNFVFYFLKSQIHLQLKQLEQALENINLCLDTHPRFDKGWLLFATLHEQKNNLHQAITGYGKFIELSGENNTVKNHLAALMLKYKQESESPSSPPFNKTYFEYAQSLFTQEKYNQSLGAINTYLDQNPHHYDAQLLKTRILAHLNDYQGLIDVISHWLYQKAENAAIWAKSLYLLSYTDAPQENIMTALQKLSDKHPNNYWLPLYHADLCIRAKKISQAITLLENVIQTSSDKTLNAKIYYQLALLYYEQRNYPQMLINLQSSYALNEHDAHLNNTLSYYWATKGKNIDTAQNFLKKARACDNTNPYFIDTHAIILYKQQKYNEAKTILEQLNTEKNSTILLHLAKIHYKLNDTKTAHHYTEKAALLTLSNHDQQTLHKIQQRLTSHE